MTGKDSSDVNSAGSIALMALAAFSTSYNLPVYLHYNSTYRRAYLRMLRCQFGPGCNTDQTFSDRRTDGRADGRARRVMRPMTTAQKGSVVNTDQTFSVVRPPTAIGIPRDVALSQSRTGSRHDTVPAGGGGSEQHGDEAAHAEQPSTSGAVSHNRLAQVCRSPVVLWSYRPSTEQPDDPADTGVVIERY